jgi:hypothetical protein
VGDHHGRLRHTAVAVALGTALLTGCSGEAAEAPSESLPSTSSPAPTTEALPAVGPADFPVPPEARTKDAAGAEAFLRYWIDLLNRQRAVPAGQPLRDLGPECQECLRIASNYDRVASAEQRYQGGDLALNDVTTPSISADSASIGFGVRQEAVQLIDAANAILEEKGAQPNEFGGIDLTWSSTERAWVVTNFGVG